MIINECTNIFMLIFYCIILMEYLLDYVNVNIYWYYLCDYMFMDSFEGN